MFRRNFLKMLGISPIFGFAQNENENPKNLPVVKFKDGKISNAQELIDLAKDDKLLVFVPKEDWVPCINSGGYGELELKLNQYFFQINKKFYYIQLYQTENTKLIKMNMNFSMTNIPCKEN